MVRRVWIDGAGDVRYIAVDTRFQRVESKVFYGFLVGMEKKGLEADKILIYKISDGKSAKTIYQLSDKLKMPCIM